MENKIKIKEVEKLLDYLNQESNNGQIYTEFRFVVGVLPEGECYVHVLNRNSTTLNIKIIESE